MKRLLFTFALLLPSVSVSADSGSLCQADEITVWSCKSKVKLYSLCASQGLAEAMGYMQYRAGLTGQVTFKYPHELVHPREHFKFRLLPHGVEFYFANGKYEYFVSEDIKGGSGIGVIQSGRLISQHNCTDSTDTLTKNETIELFKRAGVTK